MNSIRQALINQIVWEGELQFRRKEGTVYDAAVLIAPMRDGLGKLIGYVSSHRDVTESKRLEESRRRFITNISHELRTPVTNLKLYIDLLQRHYNTERQEQYFTTLNEQIERLESIIQNTVDIISLEYRQQKLLRHLIQWELLSENLLTRLRPQALAKNVTLRFEPRLANLPPIVGDPQRITQALFELIYNALNFTQVGGTVIVSGDVQTEDAVEWLTLSVCDNGPGISSSEQSHIFDRFYRGQQARAGHIPGTGLGLYMVSLIAQAHNGRLTLKSYLGQGSTFTLWFPLN
jgi:two-component system phosphate regulon sensor histidine kinase PhoR